MNTRVAVSERIAELDAAGWDRVSGPGIALDRGLLAAMEEVDELATQRRYFLVRDTRGGAAAATALRRGDAATRPLDTLLFGRAAALLRALGGGSSPVLLAGSDLGYDAALHAAGRPDDAAAPHDLLHEICAAIEAEARRERAAVCFTRVLEQECPGISRVLQERGYASSLDRPTAWLDVDWPDLGGYFRRLAGQRHKGGNKARREVARFEATGGRLERVWQPVDDDRRIAGLLERHHRRWNGEGLGLDARFVGALARHMPGRVCVYLTGPAAEAGGTSLLLRRGDRGVLALVGIDHALPLPEFAYFNLTYYGPAGDAPSLGLRRIDLGPGMVEMKIRRGCRVAFPQLFYRAHSGLGRRWRGAALALHRRWFGRKFRALRDDRATA